MKILVAWLLLLMMSAAIAADGERVTYNAELPAMQSTPFLEMYKPHRLETWNTATTKAFGPWVIACDKWDKSADTEIGRMMPATLCVSFTCQGDTAQLSISDRAGPNDVTRFWDVQKDDPPPTLDVWGQFNSVLSGITGMETRSIALSIIDDFYKDSPDHDGDLWLSRPLSPERRVLYRALINMQAVRATFAQCGKR